MKNENETNSQLADKLLSLRQKSGHTQGEISDFLGVSRQTISKWETGKSIPDIMLIKKICLCYHISSDELLSLVNTEGGSDALDTQPIDDILSVKKRKLHTLHIFIIADLIIWIFLVLDSKDMFLFFWGFYVNVIIFLIFAAYAIVRFIWLHLYK